MNKLKFMRVGNGDGEHYLRVKHLRELVNKFNVVIATVNELIKAHNKDHDTKPITIKVKYFSDVEPLTKLAIGDWVDLRSAVDVALMPGEYYLIPLGVGMILPDGYEAHVLPRSSTYNRYGIILANSMGVIDNSYAGDSDQWHFPAVALRATYIKKGDRIAQFRIVKNQKHLHFETVKHLEAVSRGGLGSTGKD